MSLTYIYTQENITAIKIMNTSITSLSKLSCEPPNTLPHCQATTDLFLSSWGSLHFLEFYIKRLIEHILFLFLASLLSIIISRFAIECLSIVPSFLLLSDFPFYGYTSLFIHSFIGGHFGCFQALAIEMNLL